MSKVDSDVFWAIRSAVGYAVDSTIRGIHSAVYLTANSIDWAIDLGIDWVVYKAIRREIHE